jgi:hypothetical protein
MMAALERVPGKTSLKTYAVPMEQKRGSALGYWGWLAVIVLVLVLAVGLLYALRAFTPAV